MIGFNLYRISGMIILHLTVNKIHIEKHSLFLGRWEGHMPFIYKNSFLHKEICKIKPKHRIYFVVISDPI